MTKLDYIFIILLLNVHLFAVDFSTCKHLINRTSFGISSQELSSCVESKTYQEVVEKIITKKRIHRLTAPSFIKEIIRPPKKMRDLNATQRMEFRKELRSKQLDLKTWWFDKMLNTNDPFLEKMVLFWHNHFTSSLQKVRQPKPMYDQNQLFRKYALGNFRKFLHAILRDPAMLIYLDNRGNKQAHPNENLARELLELFTMGEGHYSEKDIKELARGLTGYGLNKNFEFKFQKKQHDFGEKSFLGQQGKFNADDMIEIILSKEETSLYIVTKLYKEFVSYTPNAQEIQRLAKLFRENNYELKPLMLAILTSDDFTDQINTANMIKSPVELVVGSLRSLGEKNFDAALGLKYMSRLGQNLLNPPNVKGWSGGKTWIDANTLLIRKEFLYKLTRGDDIIQIPLEQNRLAQILLPLKVYISPTSNKKRYLNLILQHPTYQLK